MNVLLAALVGFFAGRMLWLALRGTWNAPALLRKNYRGIDVPTAAGIVLCLALLTVEGLRAAFSALGMGEGTGFSPMRAAALVVVMGFALLGLFDDIFGGDDARGLRGHLRALMNGNFTSGAMKVFGGIALGFVGASFLGAASLGELILDAAVIAMAANLGNLFDRRPGRSIKVGLVAFAIPAVLLGLPAEFLAPAIVVGAAAAILLDDLHERLMIGDAGANALGAAIGLAIVGATGTSGTGIALIFLIVLTLVGEFLSFSKLFDSIGPLRAFDQLGTKRGARKTASAHQSNDVASDAGVTAGSAQEPAEVPAPTFGESTEGHEEWAGLLRDGAPRVETRNDEVRVRTVPPASAGAVQSTHDQAGGNYPYGSRGGSGASGDQGDPNDVRDQADVEYVDATDEGVLDIRRAESENDPNRASVETGHVGTTSGARVRREPRTNTAYRGTGSWTANRSYRRTDEHHDEFDDMPDFSARPRTTPYGQQDRYRSPFDDKDN